MRKNNEWTISDRERENLREVLLVNTDLHEMDMIELHEYIKLLEEKLMT